MESLPALPPGFVYVQVVTTYLEMRRPEGWAAGSPAPVAPDGIEIRRWTRPPIDEYRAMFSQVGGPWGWSGRLLMDDAELEAVLADPGIEVWPLCCGPEITGFIELDSRKPGEVEIAYFGLRPEFIGRGLGRYALQWATHDVWSRPGVDRFWLHTCDYDSADALRIYQKAGFEIYDRHSGPEAHPEAHLAGLRPGR